MLTSFLPMLMITIPLQFYGSIVGPTSDEYDVAQSLCAADGHARATRACLTLISLPCRNGYSSYNFFYLHCEQQICF